MNKIPKELLQALFAGRVVPFIGAGFSYYFGYPSWKELLVSLYKHFEIHIEEKDIDGKDPLQVAEALWQTYLANNLREKQKENEKEPDKTTIQSLHEEFNKGIISCNSQNANKKIDPNIIKKIKLIKNLPIRTIVTTNYDDVLEKEIFTDFNIVYPGNELTSKEKDKTIYKIHGDKNFPSSIILTHSQYYRFIHDYGFFKSKVYTLFATNVIVMLGYGFKDINIHDIYFQYRKDYGDRLEKTENAPKCYLVLTDYDRNSLGSYYPYYKNYLKGCGIDVIDGIGTLPDFMDILQKEYHDFINHLTLKDIDANNIDFIKNCIKKIINHEDCNLKEYENDFLKVLSQIFLNPSCIKEIDSTIDLDYTGDFDVTIYYSLLDFIINYSEAIEMNPEYSRFIVRVLDFCDNARFMINDFYIYPDRFRKFISIAKRTKKISLAGKDLIEFSNLFANLLRYAGKRKGECYAPAEIIESEINNIQHLFNTYLDGRILSIKENTEDLWIYNKEVDWLEKLMNCFSSEIKDKVVEFKTLINDNNVVLCS